jgi:membrane protease YdiL (CAAX protease family)
MPGPRPPGVHWDWSGHLLALGGMLALAVSFVKRAGLSLSALGLARPVALGAAATVTAAALLVNFTLNAGSAGPREVPAETWLFLATMPGLAEELAFRGVLLAAAGRAAPAARGIAGVEVNRGAALLTLAFVALHGISLGTLFSVLPGSLLYLWLRLKTGSVIVAIVAHNLWNLTVLAAHL